MLASFGLGAAALMVAAAYVVPARYTAKSQVVVDARGRSGPGLLDDAAIETRVALLSSPGHLMRVLSQLKGRSISADETPGYMEFARKLDFGELNRNLKATKEKHSRVISVTFTSFDPDFSTLVANTSVEVFLSDLADGQRAERNEKIKSLEKQVPIVRHQLQKVESELNQLRSKSGFTEPKFANSGRNEIAELIHQLEVSRALQVQHQMQLDALKKLQIEGDGKLDVVRLRREPLLGVIFQDTANFKASMSDSDTSTAGTVGQSGDQSQSGGSALRSVVSANVVRLSEEIHMNDARVRNLEERLRTVRAAELTAREAETPILEMQRQVSAYTQLYQSVLQKLQELSTEDPVPSEVRIASVATPPEMPSSPNLLLFAAPAAVAALMSAAFLALLLDRLDTTIRTSDHIRVAGDVSCIGIMPLVKSSRKKPHYLTLDREPFSPYTEAIRSIVVSALGAGDPGTAPRIVLVTSSLESEGKTALAISVARYMSLMKRKVLLVDLNFAHPDLLAQIGEARSADASPFLGGATRRISLGFDILSSPFRSADPLTLLNKADLRKSLLNLSAGYDVVVIDGSALVGHTETRVLCEAVDTILFTVRWGSTSRESLCLALNSLKPPHGDVDPRRILAVITRVPLKKHARYRFGDIGTVLSRRQAASRA